MANSRRRLQGTVVSNKMDKSVVVLVESAKPHRLYGKVVRTTKKYMAHDENNELQIGDEVQIVESRPLSKQKRWAVETVISRAAETK
jgi:small subunit ribosomal protein S17